MIKVNLLVDIDIDESTSRPYNRQLFNQNGLIRNMLTLTPTRCAICGTLENATQLYPANLNAESFSKEVFSARRIPDHLHYRLVQCNTCQLVRSDPTTTAEMLNKLYEQSEFTYGAEVKNLVNTYGRYLDKVKKYQPAPQSLLEIGCGNGFVLSEALLRGYTTVAGVEPSPQAIACADPKVRDSIQCHMMHPGLFQAQSFDTIALFQVFDHVDQPHQLLVECAKILKPGGNILLFNHNINAFSSKLLRERSPIIDIEHTYLYSPETISKLMAKSGFDILDVGSAFNDVSIAHLLHLFPMPKTIKLPLLQFANKLHFGKLTVRLPLGNLYAIGRRKN